MKKILIANRGEIAVRIIRTCRDMGLATVAVYSDCDRNALHVRLADEAHAIGPDQASESYLRIDKLIDAARHRAPARVHPGYGFLAENPEFAEACAKAGLTFIGPGAQAMRIDGQQDQRARHRRPRRGCRSFPEATCTRRHRLSAAREGGGRRRRERDARRARGGELESAVRLARSEAQSSFGDDRVYFERLLERPAPHRGAAARRLRTAAIVPFVERECSIQRRHQKLIEETPSPAVTPALRERLMAAAAAIGRAADYTSAGTIEFLVDASGEFYFLEMNTRLQVEHPITEAVTGVDFVRAQIEIARGARLADLLGSELKVGTTTGHDPSMSSTSVELLAMRLRCASMRRTRTKDFCRRPAGSRTLRAPSGPGIRDDSGAFEGWTVPTAYDPLDLEGRRVGARPARSHRADGSRID